MLWQLYKDGQIEYCAGLPQESVLFLISQTIYECSFFNENS